MPPAFLTAPPRQCWRPASTSCSKGFTRPRRSAAARNAAITRPTLRHGGRFANRLSRRTHLSRQPEARRSTTTDWEIGMFAVRGSGFSVRVQFAVLNRTENRTENRTPEPNPAYEPELNTNQEPRTLNPERPVL